MDAAAERQVLAGVRPLDVDAVGIGELARVSVRTTVDDHDGAPGRDLDAGDGRAAPRHPEVAFDRTFELGALAEQFRSRQTEAFATILSRYGVSRDELSPEALAVIITGLSQILVLEEALGISAGHQELRAAVQSWIERYEPSG
jgi:hypothetical protein